MRTELLGYALVVIAALLWAALGPFYKLILAVEPKFTPLNIVFFRITLTSLMIFLGHGLRGSLSQRFKLTREDALLFLGYASIGIALFYTVYAYAIDAIGIGMAAILMYTAPAWVAVLSHFLFRELLNTPKVVAIVMAFAGSALVARIYRLDTVSFNALGILYGLAAGLTYGLYNIFNKLAVRNHHPLDTIMYSMGLGSLFLLPFQKPDVLTLPFRNFDLLLLLVAMSVVSSLGGGFFYITALKYIPVSVASIIANLEPVAAALMGALFFNEVMEWPQILGAGMILGGILVLQLAPGRRR